MKLVDKTKVLFTLSLMLLATIISGCTEELFNNGIILSSDTETSQFYYADEQYSKNAIKFSSKGVWNAYVTYETNSNNYDKSTSLSSNSENWLRLDSYSGNTGNNEINFEIDINTTGIERRAYIHICSDKSEKTISVQQSNLTENGEAPNDYINEKLPTYDNKSPFIKIDNPYYISETANNEIFAIYMQSNIIDIYKYASVPSTNQSINPEIISSEHLNNNYQVLYIRSNVNTSAKDISLELVFKSIETEEIFKNTTIVFPAINKCYIDSIIPTISTLKIKLRATQRVKYIKYWISKDQFADEENIENKREYFFSENDENRILEDCFNGLLPETQYFIFVKAYDEDGNEEKTEISASTLEHTPKHDLIFEVSANFANDFTVYLPISYSRANRGSIDWGDGTVSNMNDYKDEDYVNHKYDVTTPTNFTVRYSGTLFRLAFYHGVDKSAYENTILAIKQWGYTGLEILDLTGIKSLVEIATDKEGAFTNIKNFGEEHSLGGFSNTGIKYIPEGLFDYAINAERFDNTFFECENIEKIPEGLFDNCKNVKSFYRTFAYCPKITEIPTNLFINNTEVENLNITFAKTGIKYIPDGLFDNQTKVCSFLATFSDCKNLESIPEDLFNNCPLLKSIGVVGFVTEDSPTAYFGCFSGCEKLISIPSGLFKNNPMLEDASDAFSDCSLLEEIPAELFSNCPNLKYLEGTFKNCENLKTVPVSIFDNNRKVINFKETFAYSDLTGESPFSIVGESKVHIYERSNYFEDFVSPTDYFKCFKGCVNLSDYNKMPSTYK